MTALVIRHIRQLLGRVVFCCLFFLFLRSPVFAGNAEYQRCPSASWCTLGEFLYDDEYVPIATANCVLTSRDPAGNIVLNSVGMMANSDGWYAYSLDTTGMTEGLYRSQMCCTSGSDYLCRDKGFIVGPGLLSTSQISEAVWDQTIASHTTANTFGGNLQQPVLQASQIWGYTDRTLSGFGTLVGDIWGYSTRSLSTFGTLVADVWQSAARTLTSSSLSSGSLATASDVTSATVSIKTLNDYDLGDIITEVTSVQTVLGDSTDTADTTLFGKLNDVSDQIAAIDTSSADVEDLLDKWGDYDAQDIYDKVKNLSSEIASINTVSNVNSIFTLSTSTKTDVQGLENKVLAMRAILDVNRTLLEKTAHQPIIKTWLEEGSVIFKTLITNPSEIAAQTVPLTYYLPKEVKQEDILKLDPTLTVSFDAAQGGLVVKGEYVLEPKASKVIEVEVEDIWKIPEQELEAYVLQAEELAKVTEKTNFFAQAAGLKSDIIVSLAKVKEYKQVSHTPEARIRAYREAMIEMDGVKRKLNDLKTISTQVGSMNTLTGFVGGVQILAVWGLIVLLLAGFVFLALYMSYIARKSRDVPPVVHTSPEVENSVPQVIRAVTASDRVGSPAGSSSIEDATFKKSSPGFIKSLAISVLLLTTASIIGFSWYRNQKNDPAAKVHSETQTVNTKAEETVKPQATRASHTLAKESTQAATIAMPHPRPDATNSADINQKNVLGVEDPKLKTLAKYRIQPDIGEEINLRSKPSLEGEIVFVVKELEEVEKIDEEGDWIKVLVPNQDHIQAWVHRGLIMQTQ